MANTVTKGYTFGATELVTNAKLHALVDSATVVVDNSGNFTVNSSAANGALLVVNNTANPSTSVAFSELDLTGDNGNAWMGIFQNTDDSNTQNQDMYSIQFAGNIATANDLILIADNAAGQIRFVTGGSDLANERLKIDRYGDIYSNDWTDYSSTSTIVGWSGTPTAKIYTKKVGKTVFVSYSITGTSTTGGTTFTLPYASASNPETIAIGYAIDNGGTAAAGRISLPVSSSTVTLGKDVDGSTFTTSGTKTVNGQFFYMAA